MSEAGSRPFSKLSVLGIIIVFLAGGYLRFQGLGTQVVFADEIHALNAVRTQSYGYLFTHFSVTDICIPLTLYYRLAVNTVGLTEFLMRLPGALCGCATIALLAYFTWRRFGPLAGLLASGLIALSPYHVYLSREARPYPIVIFLVLIATMAVLRWARTGNAGSLYLAAGACFAAVYFHLLALPMVGCLGLYVLARANKAWPVVAKSFLIFAVLCLVFFLPAAHSLIETMSARASRGHQEVTTYRDGLALFWILTKNDWIWQAAGVAAGALVLARERRGEVVLLVLLLRGQGAAVAAASPQYSEIPWVWVRYVVFAMPFWIALAAGGMGALVRSIKAPAWGVVVVSASLIGLFAFDSRLYGLGPNRDFLVHPMLMTHELDDPAVLASLPVPVFYRQLPRGTGAVLEMPLNMVFPLYDLEQRIHGRPVFSAGLGAGEWQETFNDVPGFRFARMWNAHEPEAQPPVSYVVIHKDLGGEMRRVYQRLLETPATRRQLAGFGWSFTPETTAKLFTSGADLQRWAAGAFGKAIYEDPDIAVYQPRGVEVRLADSRRVYE